MPEGSDATRQQRENLASAQALLKTVAFILYSVPVTMLVMAVTLIGAELGLRDDA